VIGAGQAGLAAGYYLRRAGLAFAILEAGSQPDGSWPRYYDSLRLFSPAAQSALPGLPFPGDPAHYPTRDEVSAYLLRYAERWALPVHVGAQAAQITRHDQAFEIITRQDVRYAARSVIAATGTFARPYTPHLPGQDAFQGRLLHALHYQRPEPFHEQRVIVVGAGNSAVQIAIELAPIAHVTLATRRPIQLAPQELLGRNVFAWIALSGLDRLPAGHLGRIPDPRVVFDPGGYRAALKAGRPDRQPMFRSFTADGVIWPTGRHEAVDTVIFATGYRPNLDYLAPLGALDARGEPRQRAGRSTTTPGLYYLGLTGQRTFISGSLRGVGLDAAYVVRRILRYLRTGAAPR
jgi:putative flavoprotein involved in K+ transport